jgi:hypothetical protein
MIPMMFAAFEGIWLFWHLPVLIVIISLVYSATRFDPWGAILAESVRWVLRMTAFLASIGVFLYVLATFIL